jgi:hypothetical protein
MASGFPEESNKSSDLIYSHSHIIGSPGQADSNLQYFWEAFPAGSGPTHRTTYMFAYMDAGVPLCPLRCHLAGFWKIMVAPRGAQGREQQTTELFLLLYRCIIHPANGSLFVCAGLLTSSMNLRTLASCVLTNQSEDRLESSSFKLHDAPPHACDATSRNADF